MSKRRIGNLVNVVNSDSINDSFGSQTNKLSNVLIFTDNKSIDKTSPTVLPILMTSPMTKYHSAIKNIPLIKFDAEVCDANPIATVKTLAAPNNTFKLKPSSNNTEKK